MRQRLFMLFLFAFIGTVPLLCAAEELSETPPSEPLDRLKSFLNDRETFERKVRAFDKMYVAISLMKQSEAQSLKALGNAEGAKAALEAARGYLYQVKDAYELGIAQFNESALLHNFYGELLHDQLGQNEKALEHWERAASLDENYGRAQNNVGMYYLHSGRYEEGLARMDAALKADPENPDWLFNMVQVYLTNFVQVMKIRNWDRVKLKP